MADPIKVTIGGQVYDLPPIMNFAQMERIWPALEALDALPPTDHVKRTAARIAVISGALKETRPELTVPEIKSRLRVDMFDAGTDETIGLIAAVDALLIGSGLARKAAPVGEAQPPEPPADPLTPVPESPQTGNTSSPS